MVLILLGTKPKEIDVICTSKLTNEANFWLHNLSDQINSKEQALKVMHTYEKHHNENLYESIVNVIINANSTAFKEVSGMCEALEGKNAALEEKNAALEQRDAYILELEKRLAMQNA